MIVLVDHMSSTSQAVADIFTKISCHRNISILHLTQNLFNKNKFARTKNQCDATQFAMLARQTCIQTAGDLPWRDIRMPWWSYKNGYLFVDLKLNQDKRCQHFSRQIALYVCKEINAGLMMYPWNSDWRRLSRVFTFCMEEDSHEWINNCKQWMYTLNHVSWQNDAGVCSDM